MAKKAIKRRDASGSPNTVLVLFLVFFVLLSIGLGVWGYYGYSGQKKLKEDAEAKVKDQKDARAAEEYAKSLLREFRYAVVKEVEANKAEQRLKVRGDIDVNHGKDPKE